VSLFPPTREEALARIASVKPAEYARTRNALNGAVTQLSPYITHGFVGLPEVLEGVRSQHTVNSQDKFLFELGWREYYRHVWQHRGDGIFKSLHEGVLPDGAYTDQIPADILQACTGVNAIDMAVKTLYDSGYLHNHARMWLASYMVHLRKVHWRVGADWLYGHLLDGDLASNHLSWQWVAGTGSHKPYLFNAENVARFAPEAWHSAGTPIDTSYEALDNIARQTLPVAASPRLSRSLSHLVEEPSLMSTPPTSLTLGNPNSNVANGRDVWLVHPWSLGDLPADLPMDTLVIGIFVSEFHRDWPWNEKRWLFVQNRMAELASECWYGDSLSIELALNGAKELGGVTDAHIDSWLPSTGKYNPWPSIFPNVERRCDSFSKWWNLVSKSPSF
jgi:deoxyribodipyrimidine photo-lyase